MDNEYEVVDIWCDFNEQTASLKIIDQDGPAWVTLTREDLEAILATLK